MIAGINHKNDPPPLVKNSIPKIIFTNFKNDHLLKKKAITPKIINFQYIFLNLLIIKFE